MLYHTYIYKLLFPLNFTMPNITIYVDAELYEKIKKSPSKIVQEALKECINKEKKR